MCGAVFFFFQAEDGIRDLVRSRGLGDVYKRQDQLEAELTLAAGARPWDRDPIDFKLLSDVVEDRGRIPDSEVAVSYTHLTLPTSDLV